MKISTFDNSKPTPLSSAANGNAGTPANPAALAADKAKAAAPQAEASAKVALSSAAAQQLSEARADFDADKVARIAQAIRDGKFSVDAGKIADQLIGNARELLSGPQH